MVVQGALCRAQVLKRYTNKRQREGIIDKLEHKRLSCTFKNKIKEAKVRNKPSFTKSAKDCYKDVKALLRVERTNVGQLAL